MQKVTIFGVLQSSSTTFGAKEWAGWALEETVIPEGLVKTPVEVLDPEDSSGDRWVLANPDPLVLLDEAALAAVSEGELARIAKSKLTDAELAAIGVTR